MLCYVGQAYESHWRRCLLSKMVFGNFHKKTTLTKFNLVFCCCLWHSNWSQDSSSAVYIPHWLNGIDPRTLNTENWQENWGPWNVDVQKNTANFMHTKERKKRNATRIEILLLLLFPLRSVPCSQFSKPVASRIPRVSPPCFSPEATSGLWGSPYMVQVCSMC